MFVKNKHRQDFDEIIQEALSEEMNEIEPMLSSSQAWERYKSTQTKKRTARMSFLIHKKVWLPITCLVIILAVLTINPYTGNAFSKMFSFFNYMQGNVVHLFATTSEKDDYIEPALDEFSLLESTEVQLESKNLHDAQQEVFFPILFPKWLPQGYELEEIIVHKTDNEKGHEVQFIYQKDGKLLTIRQVDTGASFGIGATLDSGDATIEEVFIKHNQGNLLVFKNNYTELLWLTQDQYISIEGYLSKDEIMQIAESMSGN